MTDSMQNDLLGNEARSKEIGISLAGSSKNNITGNQIRDCRQGIKMVRCNLNILCFNNISQNDNGMNLDEGVYPEESSENLIYLNEFVDNTYDVHSFISSNSWNSNEILHYQYRGRGFFSKLGNYWATERAADADGNGIGDSSRNVGSDQDVYPLMEAIVKYKLG
jgi:parallel beta-helix repeat protein